MTSTASTGGLFWSVSFDDGAVTPITDPAELQYVRLVSNTR
jgi:hypothetical protein